MKPYDIHKRSRPTVKEGDKVVVREFEGKVVKKTCNGKVFIYKIDLDDAGKCTIVDNRPWWEAGGKWGE